MVRNLTEGRPIRLILSFSIPMLVGNIFQQLYNMVDSVIVGRYVGADALAAVGATGTIGFFLFSILFAMSTGMSIIVAQYFGAGDLKRVKRAVSTALFAMLGVSVLLSALGYLLIEPLLQLLNTPSDIIGQSKSYLTIIIGGTIAVGMYNGVASLLRALGDSMTPLIFLIVASLLNIVLDLVFILVFGMGVSGAALATVLSQGVSALLTMGYAYRRISVLHLRRKDLILDRTILRAMFRLGLPFGLQMAFIAVGMMAVQSLVNSYGTTVVAGYTAGNRVEVLAIQPGFSLAAAIGTFTGQNIGANRMDRVKQGFYSGVKVVVLLNLVVTVLIYGFAPRILALFTAHGETEVLSVAVTYVRTVSPFLVFLGVLLVEQHFLRGAGDAVFPMGMAISELVIRIVIAYALSIPLGMGYRGIFFASPAAWILAGTAGYLRFHFGRWKEKALVKEPAPSPGTVQS